MLNISGSVRYLLHRLVDVDGFPEICVAVCIMIFCPVFVAGVLELNLVMFFLVFTFCCLLKGVLPFVIFVVNEKG